MPWQRITLIGDDQQALTACRVRLANTVSNAWIMDGGDRRVVLLDGGNNVYFLSPEASLLVPHGFLQDYHATACEKPERGTVEVMVGYQHSVREFGL